MKKILFSLAALILVAFSVQSQIVRVTPGSTRPFRVNQTNTVPLHATTPYTWSVNNTSGTAITNEVAVEATKANIVSVIFGLTGTTATLTVYATGLDNCKGDNRFIDLSVEPLIYTATLSGSEDVCPQTDNNPTGGVTAAPIAITFSASITSFIYAINGVAQPSVNVGAASYNLTLATAFTNAEFGANVIEITSVTGPLGTDLQPSGAATYTVNVNEAPTINAIF